MMMTAILVAGCVLAVLSLAGPAYADKPGNGVPPSRLAVLSRGINLSHWFGQAPHGKYTREHLDTHDTAKDAALIRSLGFRHVRWTFDQGGPLDFAHFALETSPYVRARGASVRDIPKQWWDEHTDWVIDQVLLHFDANDGYVFGAVADVDLLARDVWKEFHPDPIRPELARY